jgi:rhodanese-related sulfurtransferase
MRSNAPLCAILVLLLDSSSCRRSRSGADDMKDMASVKAWVRSEFPGVDQVSTDALERELAGDASASVSESESESESEAPLLLDVRSEDEYRVSHLHGAIRVEPGGELPESLRSLPKDAPIVAYCSVGYRSSQLVERLKNEGFTNAKNLEGSIFEWANKGYPLERDGKPVRQVHPYDETWGRLLDPSLRGYPSDK